VLAVEVKPLRASLTRTLTAPLVAGFWPPCLDGDRSEAEERRSRGRMFAFAWT
jgi:hypothetical protein